MTNRRSKWWNNLEYVERLRTYTADDFRRKRDHNCNPPYDETCELCKREYVQQRDLKRDVKTHDSHHDDDETEV